MIDFKTVCLRVMIHIIVATKWVLCISGKWVFHADGVSFYPWLFNKSTVPCCLDSVDLWWRCIYGKLISVQWFQLSLMAVNGHSYSNTFHNIYLYCIWVRHLTLMACLWHIFCSWIYILLWYPDPDPPSAKRKTDLGPTNMSLYQLLSVLYLISLSSNDSIYVISRCRVWYYFKYKCIMCNLIQQHLILICEHVIINERYVWIIIMFKLRWMASQMYKNKSIETMIRYGHLSGHASHWLYNVNSVE